MTRVRRLRLDRRRIVVVESRAVDRRVVEVREAAERVFERIARLRAIGWPFVPFEQRADAAARRAEAAFKALPETTPVQVLIAAARPVLNECWPSHLTPGPANDVRAAVDDLRVAATRAGAPKVFAQTR
jgi:hypothetical protein